MKSFKEYLSESKKQYDFKIKIAGEFAAEKEAHLKTALERYSVAGFKKTGTTPTQSLPLDFPKVQNQSVSVYEVTLDYPTTSYELHEYISSNCKLHPDYLVVRKPGEPTEAYQQQSEKREGALLNDSDYKEATPVDSTKYYGDSYNASFVKALNDELKANRKARGEVIPSGDDGKTTNEVAQNNTSPVGSK